MKAKKYLEGIKTYRLKLEKKQDEIQDLYNLASSSGIDLTKVGGRSGEASDKIGNIVARIVDIEVEYAEMMIVYIEETDERIRIIESLEDSLEYDILHKLYVEYEKFRTLEEVAVATGYSYEWIRTKHGHALQKIQKIIDSQN